MRPPLILGQVDTLLGLLTLSAFLLQFVDVFEALPGAQKLSVVLGSP